MNGAAAGFSGSSAEERADEDGYSETSEDDWVCTTCISVAWEPLAPLVVIGEVVAGANGDDTEDGQNDGLALATGS